MCEHLWYRCSSMTPPFPLFLLRPGSSRLHALSPAVSSLDWPATLGFALTLAKIPLSLCMVILVLSGHLFAVDILIVLAIILDILDGVVFNNSAYSKHRHLRECRRIWDSILDRVLIWTTLTSAVIALNFPLWLFGTVFARELAVTVVTIRPYLKTGFVHAPNLATKIGATMIGAQMIWHTFDAEPSRILFGLFAGFSLLGLYWYTRYPKSI